MLVNQALRLSKEQRMDAEGHAKGYWYGKDPGQKAIAIDVLNALRDYRASEQAMRRRTRSSMGMGEKDLLALRYLFEAEAAGKVMKPKDLGDKLGITSASMTTLIDRLVESGHIRREPHPTDRRALILKATPGSDQEVRHTLGGMHRRMLDAACALSPDESQVVVNFLQHMREALDTIDEDPEDPEKSTAS
ncbi:putative transcriptional regulator, MarR family [Arthrobacter sp. Rue61a]|uniref:Transcriptional regulator, MarR family n=2 Tax=Micrococcales TaxID=85006 RepID=A1R1M1_PAEAT|nr:putative transcriptional regulator, MarR family [Paenarthrobacter aurescens TC1]AFR27253.1 putative transcriptional regulator, MarR family [Arthrobacter sp. Rue61a]